MDHVTLVLRSKSYNSVSVKCNMFASMKPKLRKFWDSYVIFMELKIVFRYKQSNVCLQRISKVFTGHLTVRRGIQKDACHVLMVNRTTT